MLTFDEETHTYRWNGVIKPGVTGILNEWQKLTIGGERYHINRYTGTVIPSHKMEDGAAKGKDLHRVSQLIMQGCLDWDALDIGYVAPAQEFEKCIKLHNIQPLYTEFPFYHPKLDYCGCIDIVAWIDKALGFIDIKTGESDLVGPQLSGYEYGYCAQERYIGRTARYVLRLPKDGSPCKFEKLTGENDFNFFKSCLFQRGYLKK